MSGCSYSEHKVCVVLMQSESAARDWLTAWLHDGFEIQPSDQLIYL